MTTTPLKFDMSMSREMRISNIDPDIIMEAIEPRVMNLIATAILNICNNPKALKTLMENANVDKMPTINTVEKNV